MMDREELLKLIEVFDRTAPSNWSYAQYKDFPGNTFIMADYSRDNPNASGSDSPQRHSENIRPAMEVIWSGFDFCQMLAELRNNLPMIIQFLKEPEWNPSLPSNKCKNCSHYRWQHLRSCNCIDSWTPETGGCRCHNFEALSES